MKSKCAKFFGVLAAACLVLTLAQWRDNARIAAENAQLRSMMEKTSIDAPATAVAEVETEKTAAAAADNRELLQLRNEAARLREKTKDLQELRTELAAANAENRRWRAGSELRPPSGTNAPGFLPRENWSFAGYSTPESTVQSFFYSVGSGDLETHLASLSPKRREAFLAQPKPPSAEDLIAKSKRIAGFRILGREPSPKDRIVVLGIEITYTDGSGQQKPLALELFGSEWKVDP
jgi:hypothetical protein